MQFYYTLFYINSCLLAAVIILKTYLFLTKSHFHQVVDWLHFSRYNIYTSGNNKVVKAKRTQNVLSVIVLIFSILDLSLLMMAHIA